MKKIRALHLTTVFMLLLTACGNTEQSSPSVVGNGGQESRTEQAGSLSQTDRMDTDNNEADAKKETVHTPVNDNTFNFETKNELYKCYNSGSQRCLSFRWIKLQKPQKARKYGILGTT